MNKKFTCFLILLSSTFVVPLSAGEKTSSKKQSMPKNTPTKNLNARSPHEPKFAFGYTPTSFMPVVQTFTKKNVLTKLNKKKTSSALKNSGTSLDFSCESIMTQIFIEATKAYKAKIKEKIQNLAWAKKELKKTKNISNLLLNLHKEGILNKKDYKALIEAKTNELKALCANTFESKRLAFKKDKKSLSNTILSTHALNTYLREIVGILKIKIPNTIYEENKEKPLALFSLYRSHCFEQLPEETVQNLVEFEDNEPNIFVNRVLADQLKK